MGSILVEDGLLITMDGRRRVIRNGSVMIEDGRIIDVGPADAIEGRYAPETKMDARGKLVLPGLVDTHIHLAQAMIRGCADDLSLVEWLQHRVWPLQGNYSAEDGRISSELCMLEMIKSGTTTFLESGLHTRYGFDGVAEALQKSGMRGVLSKMVMDGSGYGTKSGILHEGMVEDGDACLKEFRAMSSKWNGSAGGRVGVWLAARSLGAVSKELYEEIGRLGREYKTGVTMHLCEVQEDLAYAKKNHGCTPVEFADRVGLLGPNVVFAHMVWAGDGDIRLLASSGSNVAHCPASNSKLASGIAKVYEMLRGGVNVGLGCDGAPCNNTYDMVREMRLACLFQKARLLDPGALPATSALEMATLNGAKALGMQDQIGSIEAGKKADIILVDALTPHSTPSYDPVSSFVYSGTGGDVSSVIVDGKIVMEERVVKTMDEDRILREAATNGRRVMERAGIKVAPSWSGREGA